jgi:hypothetical protein
MMEAVSMGHAHDPSAESEGADHEGQSKPRKRVDKLAVIQTVTGLLLLGVALWKAFDG